MRDLVLFIHYGAPSDEESVINVRRSLLECGYRLSDVSLADPAAGPKLRRLLTDHRDKIFFFFSSNFWANNIQRDGELLHHFTSIPLVILMHDHPVYFLPHISRALDGAIIFAPDESIPDFVAKHYPADLESVLNLGWMPHFDDGEPSFEQFCGRRNMLLCPMNMTIAGMNMDDAWYLIKQLPLVRQHRATRIIDAALTDCRTPLHLIAERFATEQEPLIVDDLRHVLNFVKLWRRNYLVRTLIDMPILISSQYVPADLEFRYPEKFTLLSVQQTWPLYAEYRFTLNVAPLLTHSLHDRVTNALYRNSICVTDANAFIERTFIDERDMVFFEFGTTDMPAKIGRYLDDPQRAFELTVNAAAIRRRIFSRTCYLDLIAAVARRWERSAAT